MLKALFTILPIILIAGCVPNQQVPVPDQAMVSKSGIGMKDLHYGHAVYTGKCTKCHDAKRPKEISGGNAWYLWAVGMSCHEGITDADEEALVKYLLAAREI